MKAALCIKQRSGRTAPSQVKLDRIREVYQRIPQTSVNQLCSFRKDVPVCRIRCNTVIGLSSTQSLMQGNNFNFLSKICHTFVCESSSCKLPRLPNFKGLC
ncbi:hypothetical protein C0J52_11554 [Blattella germanica]|nr:hypothetical protein C0J52_11554 [Blattella germanica]